MNFGMFNSVYDMYTHENFTSYMYLKYAFIFESFGLKMFSYLYQQFILK